jgi:hypothetical protein
MHSTKTGVFDTGAVAGYRTRSFGKREERISAATPRRLKADMGVKMRSVWTQKGRNADDGDEEN